MVDGARAPMKRLIRGTSADRESDLKRVFDKLQWPEFAKRVEESCKTNFERRLSAALTEVDIPHLYELVRYPVRQDMYSRYTYRPDIITDLFIDRKRVILEPHSWKIFRPEDLEKFSTFYSQHGDEVYGILITDASEQLVERMKRACRIKIHKIADEIWRPSSHNRYESWINIRLRLAGLKLRGTGGGVGAEAFAQSEEEVVALGPESIIRAESQIHNVAPEMLRTEPLHHQFDELTPR